MSIYTSTKFKSPNKLYKVCYDNGNQSMKCSCIMFESIDFPCPYIIVVVAKSPKCVSMITNHG